MRCVRIAVSQPDLKVGALEFNWKLIQGDIDRAVTEKADVVVFPELAICGYPPEDLLFKPQFLESCDETLAKAVEYSRGKDLLIFIGTVGRNAGGITNSAAAIYNGKFLDQYDKIFLPNYGVFDERRYFSAGSSIPVYVFRGIRFAVNICEDIWYPGGPLHGQALAGGAEIALNLSASPFHAGKQAYREKMFAARAGDESLFLVNCNLVGGQDELVFDGASTVFSPDGELLTRMKSFEADFSVIDLDADIVERIRLKDIRRRQELEKNASLLGENPPFTLRAVAVDDKPARHKTASATGWIEPMPERVESIYKALVLGTRDYVTKNGFQQVIIAESGGVDSALVGAIACDALGPDRVKGIYLPSQFSADISGIDAHELAKKLGFELFEIPILDLYQTFEKSLSPLFTGTPFGLAEENLQSRIRGNLVMALSNKFGYLVLTTGNKSEMSAGYATLYGDMAGGFAVIKDVLKTTVYELCNYRNSLGNVIPQRILDRPPSAELRPDQKDSDSLPEYEMLDSIIRDYVEQDVPVDEIGARIGDEALAKKICAMIDRTEYKRRQAPPGIKITPRAFGRDRRMPITQGFKP